MVNSTLKSKRNKHRQHLERNKKRQLKRKKIRRQKINAISYKTSNLSIQNTTFDNDTDTEDEDYYRYRKYKDNKLTVVILSDPLCDCKYSRYRQVPMLYSVYSRPIFICPYCCSRNHIHSIQQEVEAFRYLLLCSKNMKHKYNHVLLQIFMNYLKPFLFGRGNHLIQKYFIEETLYYKKFFIEKYKKYKSQIQVCRQQYESKISKYDSHAYKLLKFKHKFSKYDWNQFGDILSQLFPKTIHFYRENAWR